MLAVFQRVGRVPKEIGEIGQRADPVCKCALFLGTPPCRACFRRRMSYIKRRAGLTSRDLSSERAHFYVSRGAGWVALF